MRIKVREFPNSKRTVKFYSKQERRKIFITKTLTFKRQIEINTFTLNHMRSENRGNITYHKNCRTPKITTQKTIISSSETIGTIKSDDI